MCTFEGPNPPIMVTTACRILSCTMLMVPAVSHAQFHALPTGDAVWVESFYIGPGYPHEGKLTEMWSSDPDTLIGGQTYRKVRGYHHGAIRDDLQGRVYYVPSGTDSEVLVYDFDVLPGDERQVYHWMFGMVGVVVSFVDTIPINGVPRKRIGFGDVGDPFVAWIQGIGSTGGFLDPCRCASVSGMTSLVCMSEDGTVQYGWNVGSIEDCAIYLGLEPDGPMGRTLVVHPNPGNDRLWIDRPKDARGRVMVTVRDALGASVGNWELKDDLLAIATGTWPAGLYLVEMVEEDGGRRATKWIRE